MNHNIPYSPFEEEPDENHNKHCYKDDEAREKHEGAREVFYAGVIDQSVEGVRDEVDKAGDERKRRENSSHFRAVH